MRKPVQQYFFHSRLHHMLDEMTGRVITFACRIQFMLFLYVPGS